MTDLQRHIAYLTDNPADKVAALALADAFQEEGGYTRFAALRKVAAVRRVKWDAEQMTHAAALLRKDSLWHHWLMIVIGASVGLTNPERHTVLIVKGRGGPKLTSTYKSNPGAFWYEHTVTVGAGWILNIVAAQIVEPCPPQGWNNLLKSK